MEPDEFELENLFRLKGFQGDFIVIGKGPSGSTLSSYYIHNEKGKRVAETSFVARSADLQPLVITEEYLTQFGLWKEDERWSIDSVSLERTDNGWKIYDQQFGPQSFIQFIHQLQNYLKDDSIELDLK